MHISRPPAEPHFAVHARRKRGTARKMELLKGVKRHRNPLTLSKDAAEEVELRDALVALRTTTSTVRRADARASNPLAEAMSVPFSAGNKCNFATIGTSELR